MLTKDMTTNNDATTDREKKSLKNGVIVFAIIEAAVLVPLILYIIFR